tara:strand:- start:674 stop:1195 length:522 start_codon:yes stop_codon:yes gene_type:complete
MQFDRPIPGQSLTTPPKAAPYERPPDVTDPREALELHLDNLMKEGAMDDVLFFLEEGLDLVTLVEGIARSAVMEGVHSIDISLIIAPVLHEFIKGAALRAGIDFEEGFENKKAKQAITYSRNVSRAKRMLKELKGEDKPDPMSLEDTEMPEPQETMEEPMEEPEQQGLMARRM